MAKKNKKPSKLRSVAFIGQTVGVVSQLTLKHDEATGQFHFEELDPKSLRVEHFYKRESGKDKILLSEPVSFSDTRFSYIESLRRDYDYLVAVDTNTRPYRGFRVSISFAYMTPLLTLHGNPIPFEPLAAYITINVAEAVNPERVGWHLILKNHIELAHTAGRHRVGIVVDSELGAIHRINAGNEPYYANYLLPDYAKLIYASDASADTLPSQMIRFCDKAGEGIFDEISRSYTNINIEPNDDQNFLGYIQIYFRVEDKP